MISIETDRELMKLCALYHNELTESAPATRYVCCTNVVEGVSPLITPADTHHEIHEYAILRPKGAEMAEIEAKN